MSIEALSFEIYVFKSFGFKHHSLIIITIEFLFCFFWGGPQESHLTPLSTRTTNKELSAESFMTKMKQ